MHRAVPGADGEGLADGPGNELLGFGDRCLQGLVPGQAAGEGRRIGAAGAVGVGGAYARGGELVERRAVVEDVGCRASSVAPLDHRASRAHRGIVRFILPYFPNGVERLVEPFCGPGAVSVAAAAHGLAKQLWLSDSNESLMALWAEILERPNELVDRYEHLWIQQHRNRKEFFLRIRDEFNASHQPHLFLYLLARIVKGSIRYSSEGVFNQSADNRRSGMRPGIMRRQILGVHVLLSGKTRLSTADFRKVISESGQEDLIYMDPPYQGTSFTRDHRYYNGLRYAEFIEALRAMNDAGLSYIVSY